MKKYLIIPILLFLSSGIFAQGVYNNGGKIVIGTGVTMSISGTGGNYLSTTNVTDGSIDLSGTLAIAGNVTNNAVADILSSAAIGGTVVLSGTTAQTLGGTIASGFTFPNLTVNNTAGIVINKNATVNGNMTFTSGLVNIGNNNFTFGPLAAVAGKPSATSMIIATGTGQVQKNWTAIGSFTFPVGDNNTTAKYSPVTLTFTSGTFAAGALTGLNLVNAKYNDPTITGSYINRYWNLSQTGITGFAYNAVYQYMPVDVVGTEALISNLKVLPTPIAVYDLSNTTLHQLSATGLTSFGTYTGGPGNYSLATTVFLEGLFNGANAMNTTLNTLNLMPKLQPYSVAPWNYAGTETVATLPAGVVDWVLVELRDAATQATALAGTKLAGWPKAFFLKTDGTIVDVTGASPNIGRPVIANNLYAVVRHRNHLSIMNANPMTLTGTTFSYNFSTAITQAYGGAAGYKQLATGLFGMVGGDDDADGSVTVLDFSKWATDFGKSALYLSSDLDGDGQITVLDFSKWALNFGTANIAPLKSMNLQGSEAKYASQVPGN